MTHPDPAIQRNQEQLLDSLKVEQRLHMERQLRIGNACYRYYMEREAEPTQEDYQDWLEGLPAHIRAIEQERGFEACKRILPLRRHAAERNDMGMDEYLKRHLSPEDYAYNRSLRSSHDNTPD